MRINCVKLVQNAFNPIVKNYNAVYKTFFNNCFSRVSSTFTQAFSTAKTLFYDLLKMSFARFTHSYTITTIYL